MSNNAKTSRRSAFQLILAIIRPRQWIKSLFLLAPALFALHIFQPGLWAELVAGVAGFSLVASAVYAFNDVINRREDSNHPIKRERPVATGELAVPLAILISIACLATGEFLLYNAHPSAAGVGAIYVLLMALYTLVLRRLLIVDVIIIAVGFVLRVLAGGTLIAEPISNWLLLCTFTIALFLGMIKRRQEIAVMVDVNPSQGRFVLSKYPDISVIDGWINILAGMTILCYALYTMAPETIDKHGTDSLIFTVPFALYGVFRYQKLALGGRVGEDPARLLLEDAGMKTVIVLWVATVIGLLFLGL